MLVLSRKNGESVVLDGGIEVVVVSIGAGRVRLGFSAPDNVRIKRSELIEQAGPPLPRIGPRLGRGAARRRVA